MIIFMVLPQLQIIEDLKAEKSKSFDIGFEKSFIDWGLNLRFKSFISI